MDAEVWAAIFRRAAPVSATIGDKWHRNEAVLTIKVSTGLDVEAAVNRFVRHVTALVTRVCQL